ncbi:DNA-protecting protein DprA [Sphingomonas oleivorans]|uniref:DNA-protecting protein DprA n=1 Tax=Sphingomonas oleivorans TaxID=1735121 RepID=A0A2T5G1H5_9SPHN|nr:DNA-processing protein DprA [Sphingomonas oleivorans]PTQ12993.1 DNA-protecting protein DprA [Sphingomonas oleivorans]
MSEAGYEDGIARLRLIRTPGIGAVTYAQLIARFGSPAAALDAVPDLARRGGGKPPTLAARAVIEREVEAVERLGARYLFVGRGLYPSALARIETAPPALIVKGVAGLLDRPMVAVVGARNASAAAVRFARALCHDLAERGLVVVSGLARGIDTAAHGGAIGGGTIGVIAGGLDIFYPPENEALQRDIAERGLLVAEQPPGIEPRARHFPYRNRIIAGLSLGTLVVEAAPRSGSLITARLAAEYGREVMAVPGSPLDSRAQGCNMLIREGATLVQCAADVIESLGPLGGLVAQPERGYVAPDIASDASAAERDAVMMLLGPVATPVDELIRQSALPPAIVQTVLLELELAGRLERHAGGRVSLA